MASYRLASGAGAVARAGTVLLLVPGRDAVALDDVDADAFSAVLGAAAVPISDAAIGELCDEATLARLLELGALVTCSEDALKASGAANQRSKRCARLTVAVSGAVQTTMFLPHIVALADTFADQVDVIVTRGAARFLPPRVFAFYGMGVWTDAFRPTDRVPVPHKYLAAADLVLVAPASAATIHRLATGACSDLASLVVAMTTAPVVIAPSMNENMWTNPAIKRNVAQLRADGVWVIEPGLGAEVSARDELNVGAITLSPEQLVRTLEAVLAAGSREQ